MYLFAQIQQGFLRYGACVALACVLSITSVSAATGSPNFLIDGNPNSGSGVSGSPQYTIDCSQIGGVATGISQGLQYLITSGVPCVTPVPVQISFRIAPEKRVPLFGLNLSENVVSVAIKFSGTPVSTPFLPATSGYLAVDADGYSINPIVTMMIPGQYDFKIKTQQHLSFVVSGVVIQPGINIFDFTDSLTKFLEAGDVNSAPFGDDAVNALDISKELQNLGSTDVQTDLNRDTTVNALDIGILLANLGKNHN